MENERVTFDPNRDRIGLILRVFAPKPEQIPERTDMLDKAIARGLTATLEDGRQMFSRIDVLVWNNSGYSDSDCGRTYAGVKQIWSRNPLVHVTERKVGDLFCGLLNYGVALQSRHRIDYSVIASNDAYSYMTPETFAAMCQAVSRGALAVGVAINELTQSILEGRIANTLAMWHNLSLLSVGGFDRSSRKAKNDKLAHYMKGWHPDKGEVYYELAGVEEVVPLAWLVEDHGSCVAPVLPAGDGVQQYQIPDPDRDRELWLRYVSKMGTKLERQSALLAGIGFDLSHLRGGVMPEYRKS